jgi:hypothetical protein
MKMMEQKAREAGDELSGFIVIDEDFFLHTKRAREFLECVREGGRPLSIMGFGSVRGLSQFTADEIAEMGFDLLWTAVEATESGFEKLKGKEISELYGSLKSRGVALLSSMIIGFPYQNRERVMQEFRQLVELGPSLWQILIYFAFPGTPFHKQVIKQGSYLPEYRENPDHRKFDGFSMHFTHANFTPKELEDLQRELYQKGFELLGPSLIRVMRAWFEGYKNLKDSANPLLCGRAGRMRDYVRSSIAGLYPAMIFGPNRQRRAEARAFLKEIEAELGRLTIKERVFCWATIPLAVWTWLTARLNIFQQPKLLRLEHRMVSAEKKKRENVSLRKRLQPQPVALCEGKYDRTPP